MKSNLKQIMADKGATILGLADNSGISQRTIQKARDHRIESCTLKTLAAIAKALGCQVKDLFEDVEQYRKWATNFPTFEEAKCNLPKTANEARKNGKGLLEDARLLFDNDRYARAASLAILAEEELAKCMMLNVALEQNQWDQDFYSLFRRHNKKQAISQGTMAVAQAIIDHYASFPLTILPTQPPSQRALEDVVSEKVRKLDKKQHMDKLKQDAQFIGIDKLGRCTSRPQKISKQQAGELINMATRTESMLAATIEKIKPRVIRPGTVLKHSKGKTIYKYKEGFDVDFSITAAKETCDPCLYNTTQLFQKYGTFDPVGETDVDTLKFIAQLNRGYGVIEQLEKQMNELGLRHSPYLERCKEIDKQYPLED